VNMKGEGVFDIVTASVAPSAQGVTVIFNYNSREPYSYMVVDLQGRVVVQQDNQKASEGLNVLEINTTLSRGVYQVVLRNSQKVVSRKLFY
jgi:type IX secretion system substrate protein